MFIINLPLIIALFVAGLNPQPRALIFGDSLTHDGADNSSELHDVDITNKGSSPGQILGELLTARGYQVKTDSNVGRSFYNFWHGGARYQFHTADYLIKADLDFQPNVVIIMLGTNDLGLGIRPEEDAMADIRDAFAGIKVIAVGPPIYVGDENNKQAVIVYNLLNEIFEHVIDARPLSSKSGRTGDGQHFQYESAKSFANNLLKQLH